MTSIENTYICLAAPLLLAILCLRRDWRRALAFLLAGMTVCLLSAYISSFAAAALHVDLATASYEVSPAVEEAMKFLPVLFYILVFEPGKGPAMSGSLLVAVGFATFENVCFLTSYGTSELLKLIIRGFGTGAMHVVCGMVVSLGLFLLWDRAWLRIVGTFSILCAVITFHAIFNMYVNQTGVVFWVGSAVPLTILSALLAIRQRVYDRFR